MHISIEPNALYYGDCLEVMEQFPSDYVDLIYLDPPFNSDEKYNTIFKGSGLRNIDPQIKAFDDIWTWDEASAQRVAEVKGAVANPASKVIEAFELFIPQSKMLSYTSYMAQRLFEMRRVLKDEGSIYLHCDPTASHYLKLVMDAIFGVGNFLADITWKRYAVHSLSKSAVDTISDHLLYYAKDDKRVVANRITLDLETADIDKKFPHKEVETGRRFQHVALEQSSNSSSAGEPRNIGGRVATSAIGWRWTQSTFDERISQNPYLIYWTRNGRPRYKIYADEYLGEPVGNIWTDIPYLAAGDAERLGYPTQKPLALLERIIKASTATTSC